MNVCPACNESAGFRIGNLAVNGDDGHATVGRSFKCRGCGHVTVVRDDVEAPPAVPAPTPLPPHRPPVPASPLPTPPKPVNVLAVAKARLRDVERELRNHERLQREREELKAIISAATAATRRRPASVSPLRKV